MTIALNPTTTPATINYLVPPPDGARAYGRVSVNLEKGEKEKNYDNIPKNMVIENVRGKEESVTLDTA
ncbi:hypothetical protein BDQ12DRAFT_730037, partial [Crucibulum laeve]